MIVITIIEQGKMQYRPTLISNLYSHLNKHRLMSIFRDIMALLVSIYRDHIFLISPSTTSNDQLFTAVLVTDTLLASRLTCALS